MPSAAKNQPDNFDEIFQLGKYLTEKCSSEWYQQLYFKYFIDFFSLNSFS